LALEVRFQKSTELPDKLVKPYRDAQVQLKVALEAIEGERRQNEEYGKLQASYENLRPKVNILRYLVKATREMRLAKVSAKGDAKRMKRLEEEEKLIEARRKEMGELGPLREKLECLKKEIKEKAKELDLTEKLIELNAAEVKARKKMEKLSRSSMNLGQGLDPAKIGGDPAMITSELYTNLLTSVLVDMGPEALPEIKRGMRRRSLLKTAEAIEKQWTQSRWVISFALAAASGKTKVALAADRFLKKRTKVNPIPALIEALPKAKPIDRPAYYRALKNVSGVDLPDRTQAWLDWWKAKDKGGTPIKNPEDEDEDEEE